MKIRPVLKIFLFWQNWVTKNKLLRAAGKKFFFHFVSAILLSRQYYENTGYSCTYGLQGSVRLLADLRDLIFGAVRKENTSFI